MKRKVLFLCTGISCRSEMAEAIVNVRLGDEKLNVDKMALEGKGLRVTLTSSTATRQNRS